MAQWTGEILTRTRSRSTDHNERLEPQLLRTVQSDNLDRLREIIEAAHLKNQLNENFLCIGLIHSSEKGRIGAIRYLLSQGAKPYGAAGNRLSPLLRAVERNHISIVQLLLAHGTDRETRDKKGRY
jgi:ankyrin repeat protein